MKTRIAFALCLGVCSLSVLLPLGIFYIQDSVAVDKDIVWQSSTEDIAKNYPVVSRVYANFYQGNETMMDNESFHLSDMSAYTEKQQSQLTEVKKKYSRELNQLLAQGIFPYELLDLKKGEPFSVEFGTLSQMSEKSGVWQLNQVYRLNTANDNIGDFTLDKQTEKILNLEFYRHEVKQYSEQERKEFAWNMIQYLGLDSLKDWTYTRYGYESYQAKVQVYCEVEDLGDSSRFTMGITPLGQHTSTTLYNYIQP